jgi:hypothetical protein
MGGTQNPNNFQSLNTMQANLAKGGRPHEQKTPVPNQTAIAARPDGSSVVASTTTPSPAANSGKPKDMPSRPPVYEYSNMAQNKVAMLGFSGGYSQKEAAAAINSANHTHQKVAGMLGDIDRTVSNVRGMTNDIDTANKIKQRYGKPITSQDVSKRTGKSAWMLEAQKKDRTVEDRRQDDLERMVDHDPNLVSQLRALRTAPRPQGPLRNRLTELRSRLQATENRPRVQDTEEYKRNSAMMQRRHDEATKRREEQNRRMKQLQPKVY